MNFFGRLIRRLFIFIVTASVLWFIVTQIFNRIDQRLPFFIALLITYLISAYILLPPVIRVSNLILKRDRISGVTYASDGLAADPVNILLKGTVTDLITAFTTAGWYQADRLTFQSAWKMISSFIFNKPYPEAPFSPLYIFGRIQDFGFQENIGPSPRKRNHVRFWAANIDPQAEISDLKYWIKKHPVDLSKSLTWVGAATKDNGFGLSKLTFQISHRTDKYIDKERDYIIKTLKKFGWIHDERYINTKELVEGKYHSDNKIFWARLGSPTKN